MRLMIYATLLTSTALLAQTTQPVVRALPKIATDGFTGRGSFSIPAQAFRAEYWFSGSQLPLGAAINSVGMRGLQGSAVPAQTRTMEVVMANVALGFRGVTSSFGTNLGPSPVTFFSKKPISFPGLPPVGDPNQPMGWIVGDQPFPFAGPNLVMDFRVEPNANFAVVTNDGFQLTATQNTLFSPGRVGCGQTMIGKYTGSDVLLTVTQVPPQTGVFFNLGLEDLGLVSGLPVDLSPFGMQNCHLGTAPLASGMVTADVNGRADLSMPYTIFGPVRSFVAQAIHAKVPLPITAADYATTNTLNVSLGYEGVVRSLFALGSNASTAPQGPSASTAGVVFLLR